MLVHNEGNSSPWPLVVAGAVLMPTLLVLGTLIQPWVDPVDLWRDPLAVAALRSRAAAEIRCCPVYMGMASQVLVMVWGAAAGIALAASLLLFRLGQAVNARFLLSAGVLTALLGVDDALMLHEASRQVIARGEIMIFAIYGLLAATHFFWFRNVIMERKPLVLGVSLLFLGASLMVDVLRDTPIIEDPLKAYGLFFWLAYHTGAAGEMLFEAAGVGVARTRPFGLQRILRAGR